jgi:hypothetical protein
MNLKLHMTSLATLLLWLGVFVGSAQAMKLPQGLDPSELNSLIETLGFGNTTRVMRSAEAYAKFPGLRITLETPLVPSESLNQLGSGSASLPIFIPSPRLHISKGIGLGLELSLDLSSQEILETVATVGFLSKWTFHEEREGFVTSALFLGYTKLDGFHDTYSGNNFELGILASKDFVRLKPYIGFGILLATGKVPQYVCLKTQSGTAITAHFFLGTEIELPMNIAFQLDFTQTFPSASFSLGYHF